MGSPAWLLPSPWSSLDGVPPRGHPRRSRVARLVGCVRGRNPPPALPFAALGCPWGRAGVAGTGPKVAWLRPSPSRARAPSLARSLDSAAQTFVSSPARPPIEAADLAAKRQPGTCGHLRADARRGGRAWNSPGRHVDEGGSCAEQSSPAAFTPTRGGEPFFRAPFRPRSWAWEGAGRGRWTTRAC